VKKLLQLWRAGRDIGKVLWRYFLTLTTGDEKLLNMFIRYQGLLPLPSQMNAIINFGDIFARPTP